MSYTKKLLESVQKNLNEDARNEVYNMNIEEMKKKYAKICEEADLSFYDVLEQLDNYGCLNTGSFRDMLIDTINYLNDNN